MSRTARAGAMATLLIVVAMAPAALGGAAAQTEEVTLTLEVVNTDGDTVGDVELAVEWDGGSETVTTRASGQALVDVPRGSNPTVTVSHDIYMRNFPYEITNATQDTVQIPVSRSGTVEVTASGATGPVDDATVRLVKNGRNAATGKTGGDGVHVAGPVERGEYGLVVSKPGYFSNASTIQVDGGESRTVQIRPGAVQLRFNVTDDHFSPPSPVENATISIAETGDDLSTLENGQRVTTVPVNRPYTVTVTKDGYRSLEREIRVGEEGRVVNLSISREPALHVALVNERVVVGESTLLTATNEYGEPVTGAGVSLDGSTVGETNAEGELSVPIEETGDNAITVTAGTLENTTVVEGIEPATPTTTTTPTPTTTTTQPPTAGGGPGFTVPLAVLALLALASVAMVARRRRTS
jgi:hypothetical protein